MDNLKIDLHKHERAPERQWKSSPVDLGKDFIHRLFDLYQRTRGYHIPDTMSSLHSLTQYWHELRTKQYSMYSLLYNVINDEDLELTLERYQDTKRKDQES
jgi:hypothetical protein